MKRRMRFATVVLTCIAVFAAAMMYLVYGLDFSEQNDYPPYPLENLTLGHSIKTVFWSQVMNSKIRFQIPVVKRAYENLGLKVPDVPPTDKQTQAAGSDELSGTWQTPPMPHADTKHLSYQEAKHVFDWAMRENTGRRLKLPQVHKAMNRILLGPLFLF